MWLNDASIHSLLLLLISIACNFSSTESKKKEKTDDPEILKLIQDEIYRSMKRMAQDTIEHTDVNKYVAFKEKTETEEIVQVNTWLELKQEVKEKIIYIETGMWPGDETPKKEANKPQETEAAPQQAGGKTAEAPQAGGKGVAAPQTGVNATAKQTQVTTTVEKKSTQKEPPKKEKPPPKKEPKDSSKAVYTIRHYVPHWSAKVTEIFAKRQLTDLVNSFVSSKDWRPLGGYEGGSGAKLFLTDDEKYVLKLIQEREGSAIIRKYDIYAKYVTGYPKNTPVDSLIVTNFGYFVYEDKKHTIRILIMDNLSYGLTAKPKNNVSSLPDGLTADQKDMNKITLDQQPGRGSTPIQEQEVLAKKPPFTTYDLKGNGERIIADEPKTFLNKIFRGTGNTVSKQRPANDGAPADKRSGTPSSDNEKKSSRSSSPDQASSPDERSSRGGTPDKAGTPEQRSSRDSSPNNGQSPNIRPPLPGTFPQDKPMEAPTIQRMSSSDQRTPSSGRSTPTLPDSEKDVNGNEPNNPDDLEVDPIEVMKELQVKEMERRAERAKLGVLTEPHIIQDFGELRIVDVEVIYYDQTKKESDLDNIVAQSFIGWGLRIGRGWLEQKLPFLKPEIKTQKLKKTVAKPVNNKYIEIIKKDREILEKMKITDYSLAVFVSETAIDPKGPLDKIRKDNPQETYTVRGEKVYKMHLAYIDTWVIYEGVKIYESKGKRFYAWVTGGDPEKVTVQDPKTYNKRIGVFLADLIKPDKKDQKDNVTVLYNEADDQPAPGNRQKRQTAILPNYYH